MDVFISGVGMTKFGRSKESLQKMMAEAASSALKEAQLERVDAIYMGVMNVEEFVGDSNFAVLLADTLGLTGIPSKARYWGRQARWVAAARWSR